MKRKKHSRKCRAEIKGSDKETFFLTVKSQPKPHKSKEPFFSEEHRLFKRRYEEGYDMPDPRYNLRLQQHTDGTLSPVLSSTKEHTSAIYTNSRLFLALFFSIRQLDARVLVVRQRVFPSPTLELAHE